MTRAQGMQTAGYGLPEVMRKLNQLETQLAQIQRVLEGSPDDIYGNRKGLLKRVLDVEEESAVTLAAVMASTNKSRV